MGSDEYADDAGCSCSGCRMTTPAKPQKTPVRPQKAQGKVRVHYRLVRGRTGAYDAVIRWYSRSPYTHAEFCWPLENPRPPQYLGAQPKGGVAIRPANYLEGAPFDTFAVEVTQDQADVLRKVTLSQVGKPYDFRAIFGMVFQWLDRKGRRPNAFFCSDQVFYDFAKIGKQLLNVPIKQSDRITPRDLGVSTVATMVKP